MLSYSCYAVDKIQLWNFLGFTLSFYFVLFIRKLIQVKTELLTTQIISKLIKKIINNNSLIVFYIHIISQVTGAEYWKDSYQMF